MKREIANYMKRRSKCWWTSLLVGIVAIVLGVWCLMTPANALAAITYTFIVGFILSGIFDIVFSISNKNVYYGWWWTFSGGIIDLLFGLFLAFLPLSFTTTILVYFVGFWILFRSIWTIGIAVELNRYTPTGWLLAFGILSLLFSIFYLFSPSFGSFFIVTLVSIAFLFYGVFRIYYSIQLRNINKAL